ncbi:MAG: SoxR reducing system RseC family protein [Nitrospirota bacterium]
MNETGIVTNINGTMAIVKVSKRNSCCESCEKEICDISEDGIETEAINMAGAKIGQKVKLVMKSYTFVKGAILIYIVPILALIAGSILGKTYLPGYFTGTDSDLLAAIGGFLLFFASLIVVKLILSRMEKKTESKSVIESIVEV